jgi:hypothetical protein
MDRDRLPQLVFRYPLRARDLGGQPDDLGTQTTLGLIGTGRNDLTLQICIKV